MPRMNSNEERDIAMRRRAAVSRVDHGSTPTSGAPAPTARQNPRLLLRALGRLAGDLSRHLCHGQMLTAPADGPVDRVDRLRKRAGGDEGKAGAEGNTPVATMRERDTLTFEEIVDWVGRVSYLRMLEGIA